MVSEPYDYEGDLMLEQTYPIVVDGQFRGVAGVDRTLERISDALDALKQRQVALGWHPEIFLVSRGEEDAGPRGPRVIATTLKAAEMRTKPIDATLYGSLLRDFHSATTTDRVVTARDPLTKVESLYAAAKVPSGGWTVVMQIPTSDLVGRVRGVTRAFGAHAVHVDEAAPLQLPQGRPVVGRVAHGKEILEQDPSHGLGDRQGLARGIGQRPSSVTLLAQGTTAPVTLDQDAAPHCS
jgi:hypothetical protein